VTLGRPTLREVLPFRRPRTCATAPRLQGSPPAIDALLVETGIEARPGALSLATVPHRLPVLSQATPAALEQLLETCTDGADRRARSGAAAL
jgi:hypothetical protein